MAPQIYDPKMKEVTVMSDDEIPLARKQKSSTSDAADGGKKKKTEGGASKKTTAALEAEKRRTTGIFAKAPPLVYASHSPTLSIYLSCSYTYVFRTFQEESHDQPQEDLQNFGGFSKYQRYAASRCLPRHCPCYSCRQA